MNNASRITQKLWSYCNILRDDGLSYQDYMEQLTTILFLKMAEERAEQTGEEQPIPPGLRWSDLSNPKLEGSRLEFQYRKILRELGKRDGLLGLIFRKSQNKIQDPAKLRQLIFGLIGKESWLDLSIDVKGDAYEGLLEKNAQDVKGGAGQYFTPRPLIDAIIECIRPSPGETICDPACGTGGFLLAAHHYIANNNKLDKSKSRHLRFDALRGVELVDGVSRLCAMNLYLHGIGPSDGSETVPLTTDDALRTVPSSRFDVVLSNPPFGRKSSVLHASEADKAVVRSDFWASTNNKQLNFVQHIYSLLKPGGRAAVIVPDNVLFEGGAGEVIRRKLIHECNLHTVLRLPSGIFYAHGVKANVLFFQRRRGGSAPNTKEVWFYDLRTNQRFSLKQNRLVGSDLSEFVVAFNPENIRKRVPSWTETTPAGRWRAFTREEILARDKANMEISWLRDDSLEDSSSHAGPLALAEAIIDDLRASLEQIEDVAAELRVRVGRPEVARLRTRTGP